MNARGAETILLVEDEEAVRHLLARGLRNYGFTVMTASDGAEALRLVHDRTPHIDLLADRCGHAQHERPRSGGPPAPGALGSQGAVHERLHRRHAAAPRRVRGARGLSSKAIRTAGIRSPRCARFSIRNKRSREERRRGNGTRTVRKNRGDHRRQQGHRSRDRARAGQRGRQAGADRPQRRERSRRPPRTSGRRAASASWLRRRTSPAPSRSMQRRRPRRMRSAPFTSW